VADYRNFTLQFHLGGINVAVPPEAIGPGQHRIGLNLRPNTEGVIEGRSPTAAMRMIQSTINGRTFLYPSQWSTGPLREIRYIGTIKVDGVDAAGYLSTHAATPLPEGFADSTIRVFVNGVPVLKRTGYATTAVLTTTGVSIIRGNAPNGVPVIMVDGQWYLILNTLDNLSPHASADIDTGYVSLTTAPRFIAKRLGIPKPAAAPTLAALNVGGGLNGDYYYRTSGYDSTTGFQGPPSAASAVITISGGDDAGRVTLTDTNTYGNFTHHRVWRLGGTLLNTWRLVGSVASTNSGGSITFDDTSTDAAIALAEALDIDSVEIFTSIDAAGATAPGQKFVHAFGPFIGNYVFWVGDSKRKNYVYWNRLSDLARHDPSDDVNAVSDPGEELLNGFVFGNNPYVFSNKRFYALDFLGQDARPAFTTREIPIGIGIAGRYAFAVAPNLVFICSKDGIYTTNAQSDKPLDITSDRLKPIFRGESVGGLEPVDYLNPDAIRLAASNKELHFFYKGKITGATFHLVFDIDQDRWFQWSTNRFGISYPNEGVAWNQFFLGHYNSQQISTFDDVFESEDESYTARFRSGSLDAGAPLTHKEWGVFMLDYDPAGADITITPFYDSELVTGDSQTTVTQGDHGGRRTSTFSLEDFYAKNISLQFEWQEEPTVHPVLYQAVLLYREDEEAVVHWEHPPQSLGQAGLYHIKDAYWGVRSTAPITLRIFVDGEEDIYENIIPDTDGEREKVYVELTPRVGKIWGFQLDSTEPFRFYGEDTVLFAKPWQTESGYQGLTPFSQAGYAAFLRKGGGT
jgi:hypothetical protein